MRFQMLKFSILYLVLASGYALADEPITPGRAKGFEGHGPVAVVKQGAFRQEAPGARAKGRVLAPRIVSFSRNDLRHLYGAYSQNGRPCYVEGSATPRCSDQEPYCSLMPALEDRSIREPYVTNWGIFRQGVYYHLEMPGSTQDDNFVTGHDLIEYRLRDVRGRTVAYVRVHNLPRRNSLNPFSVLTACMGHSMGPQGVNQGILENILNSETLFASGVERARLPQVSPTDRFGNRGRFEGAGLPGGTFSDPEQRESLREAIRQYSIDRENPGIYREYWENQYSRVPLIP